MFLTAVKCTAAGLDEYCDNLMTAYRISMRQVTAANMSSPMACLYENPIFEAISFALSEVRGRTAVSNEV